MGKVICENRTFAVYLNGKIGKIFEFYCILLDINYPGSTLRPQVKVPFGLSGPMEKTSSVIE